MKRLHAVLMSWGLLICTNAGAEPSEKAPAEAGREIFGRLCASCHGVGARGDGVVTEILKVQPPNLTTIALRNNGWDSQKVMGFIDGRERIKSHGTLAMPVWGERLGAVEGASAVEQDIRLRTRLFALVMYLKSIQVSAASAP